MQNNRLTYFFLTENSVVYLLSFTHAAFSAPCQLYAGFLLGLLFDPEDGRDMYLQNFR
jgi:hypothetical protein